MTRFKEQRRIEAAIKHRNSQELAWALSYCQQRLELSSVKQHEKHWMKLIKEIEQTMEEIEGND